MKTLAPTADYYPINRQKYVRVSRVLDAVGATDFSSIPERDREVCLARGQGVHRVCEDINRGTDGQYDYDPRVVPYGEAYRSFLRDTGFKPLPGGIECRVHRTFASLGLPPHPVYAGVAGTYDVLGTVGPRLWMPDLKTSAAPSSTGKQTALYTLLLPGYEFNDIERYGLALRADGTYRLSARYPYTDRADVLALLYQFITEKKS